MEKKETLTLEQKQERINLLNSSISIVNNKILELDKHYKKAYTDSERHYTAFEIKKYVDNKEKLEKEIETLESESPNNIKVTKTKAEILEEAKKKYNKKEILKLINSI